MSTGEGERPDEPLSEAALIAIGLPYALQVARRMARTTRVLEQDDLEGIARLTVKEIAGEFDPERGNWKSFVCARVGYALLKALRREHRAAILPAEHVIEAGLAHVEGLEPARDPLSGSDEEAYLRLVEVTSEVADVLALHADAAVTKTLMHGMLAELPAFEARVIELHYLDGLSFRQIAAKLGCKHVRAYRAHERALPRLRRRLRGLRGPQGSS
jgi:RNA polymerase sigma factor FliA